VTTDNRDPRAILGDRVRSLRAKRAISQEQLADLAELDRTYISGVERGIRNISLMNIVKIADALEVNPSELLKGI
jgi:transcriptional regulator with XRE-family HTH domain